LTYTAIVAAIAAMGIIFGTVGILAKKKGFQSIPEYFLASRSVRAPLVISLLISGSFSLNGMLYQIYLGYKIGAWSLLTQFAWALSFVFLANFGPRIAQSAGMHNFIGSVFSTTTRKLAALCSIIGLGLQIGWEYNVAKSAFGGLASPALPDLTITLMTLLVFAIGTFYTLVGGMRSNSWTDLFENLLKIGCFVFLLMLIIGVLETPALSHKDWANAIFPPPSAAIAELTFSGLVANLVFSLAWQFVDMTTWQTAIVTQSKDDPGATSRSLYWAGFAVFLAPGVLGTFLGLGLVGQSGLDSNSVLPALIRTVGGGVPIVVLMTVAISATVMSFIDGMLLGIGYTFITDLLFSETVDRLGLLRIPDEKTARDLSYQQVVGGIMSWTRVALIAAAIAMSFGLGWFSDKWHIGLFDMVYLVIVGQLSIFGPSLVGLLDRRPYPFVGPFAILVPLVIGYGLAIYGTIYKLGDLVNWASVIALSFSFGIAFFGSRRADKSDLRSAVAGG